MSILESMIIQAIIIYIIQNGINCTSEVVHKAYSDVRAVSKLCRTVDMPVFERSLRFITKYLQAIHVLIDLFLNVLRQ